jgi:mycothiol synthase
VNARGYRDERDWWAIRSLLVESWAVAAPGWNWDIRRWDGWRFHREVPLGDPEMRRIVGLWESPVGELVAAAHREELEDAWIELRPDRRDLEPAILEWCEEHLAATDASDEPSLRLFVDDADAQRQRLLTRRGYEMQPNGGWQRWLRFSRAKPNTAAKLRDPYRLRTTLPTEEDCARMAALLNAAFGRAVHTSREYRTFIDRSPSFEPELNLVAVAPDGSFAAHVGVTYDASNEHGMIEPVCTAPAHQRQGLASALLGEGIRRLAARGAQSAALDTGDDPAVNAFYAAAGFVEAHHGHWWRRRVAPVATNELGAAHPPGAPA